MKKLMTSLTALALVSAMVVPVAAFAGFDGGTGVGNENQSEAQADVVATYTIHIPSTITITADGNTYSDVYFSEQDLTENQTVTVTVSGTSATSYLASTAGSRTVAYSLTADAGSTWKTGGNTEGNKLSFTMTSSNNVGNPVQIGAKWGTKPLAGHYTEILTFNVG